MFVVDPMLPIWLTLVAVVLAVTLYSIERIPNEMVSLSLIGFLLIFFHFVPVSDEAGRNLLGAGEILEGFANPALMTVVALLVVGQGIVNTGSLDHITRLVFAIGRGHPFISSAIAFLVLAVTSAFLNNTPVVVIFIPIIQSLAARLGVSPSRMMMSVSFMAILGGMTTLIGTSTNLLVSSSLIDLGYEGLGFFQFTVPGLVLASLGFFYVLFIMPRLLPDRATLAGALVREEDGKQFIAQITLNAGSKLVGEESVSGMFAGLKSVTVRMIQRGEHAILPPFERVTLKEDDILIVAATRKMLTDIITRGDGILHADYGGSNGDNGRKKIPEGAGQILGEVMIAPGSRLVGQNLEQIGFRYRYHCIVLGLQRRSRMIRARMTEIPLEEGDVLLIQGNAKDMEALRASRDILPMEWSASAMPSPMLARRANIIFAAVVLLAAFEIVPIVITSILGAVAMIYFHVLNLEQAGRAVDRGLVMMVGASLALGSAMQATGAATYLAEEVLALFSTSSPAVILSAFFLLVALLTNVLSNNACAVLFTPIGVGIAQKLGVDPLIFASAVLFAANCSYATPIGYQTNLLVMAPGNYRFADFMRAGAPLVFLIWAAFSLFAPWYYGL